MRLSGPDNRLLRARIYSTVQLCDIQNRGYVPLTTLLNNTRYCECSDPRDRKNAVLSLLDPRERVIGIEADYSQTVSAICQNAALCTARFNEDLGILAAVDLEQDYLKLPSWVPNWPCRAIAGFLDYSVCASGGTSVTNIGHQADEGILQVTGISVATIDHVESFKLPDYNSVTNTEENCLFGKFLRAIQEG